MDGPMISGTVTGNLEAIVRITVRGPTGRSRRIRAVLDTGFNGCLTLPPALIAELELPWDRRAIAELADGSETVFDICRVAVIWDRRSRTIRVHEADATPLIGMELMSEHEVTMKVRQGGAVTIKPLRPRR